MTRAFNAKRGDSGLSYDEQLKSGRSPLDLRDAEAVRFYMQTSEGDLLAKGDASITDAANGRVRYTLSGDDTARKGTHQAEWVVHWDDPDDENGRVETIPQRGFFQVRINPRVNRGLDPAETTPGDYRVRNLEATEGITTPSIETESGPTTIAELAATLAENMDADGQRITNLGWPDDPDDAVVREFVDEMFSGEYVEGMSNPATAPLDMARYPIENPGEIASESNPAPASHAEHATIQETLTFGGDPLTGVAGVESLPNYWERLTRIDVDGPFHETIDLSDVDYSDEIKIVVHVQSSPNSGANMLQLRIDGLDAEDYEWIERAGAELQEGEGDAFDLVEIGSMAPAGGEWRLMLESGGSVDDTVATQPVIYGNGGSRGIGRPALQHGSIDLSGDGIIREEIQLFTDDDLEGGWIDVMTRRMA